jgi:hypothetical protein
MIVFRDQISRLLVQECPSQLDTKQLQMRLSDAILEYLLFVTV